VGVVVETGLQLNSHDKSITFNHKCEQSTAGVGKKFTFYCFDPQGMHHMDETVPGIFSRNVRVSIKNKLNQRISISKITIFENQGIVAKCIGTDQSADAGVDFLGKKGHDLPQI